MVLAEARNEGKAMRIAKTMLLRRVRTKRAAAARTERRTPVQNNCSRFPGQMLQATSARQPRATVPRVSHRGKAVFSGRLTR